MSRFLKYLSGGDLRSIGKSDSVIPKINTQQDFDELFKCLYHHDRIVVMRAADCIEKITATNPVYVTKHKKEIFDLSRTSTNKELVWHLAQLIPRLNLNGNDLKEAWNILCQWALDKSCSRIVRVNALESLSHLAHGKSSVLKRFNGILSELEEEKVPSINARIRKIRKQMNS
jgi:hypothetical protein